jgi:hypothetical protein
LDTPDEFALTLWWLTIGAPGDRVDQGVWLGVGVDVGKLAISVEGLWRSWGELSILPSRPAEIAVSACGGRKNLPSHLMK